MKTSSDLRTVVLGRTHTSPPLATEGDATERPRKFPVINVPMGGEPIAVESGHIMTIAPGSSEMSKALVTSSLTSYAGSVVVVDCTGGYYTATAEVRRAMGQKVLRLDPFGVLGEVGTDAINPRDLIDLSSPTAHDDCLAFVTEVLAFPVSSPDYWDRLAVGFAAGVIGYICAVPEFRSVIRKLTEVLNSKDTVYNLSVVIDTIGKKIPPFAYNEITAFLQINDADRSRVLAATYSHLQGLTSEAALKSLDHSTVPLTSIADGEPVSIYLMVPPHMVASRSRLLRVWIATLLAGIARRKGQSNRTLMILDECAQLGVIEPLRASPPIWEQSSVLLWTIWRDVNEALSIYSPSWAAMAKTVQVLPTKNFAMASAAAGFLGFEAEDVTALGPDEQIVWHDGASQRIKNAE